MKPRKRIWRSTFLAAWLGLLSLLVLAGCMQEAAPPVSQAVSVPAEPTLVFGMVTKDKNNTYMQKMYEGFAAACKELNIRPILKGPDEINAEAQVSLVEELIGEGADVILIAANDPDKLQPVLTRAMEQGIAVISLDSAVAPESRTLHIQQADPEKVGRVLIQAAHSMMDGEGEFAFVNSTPYATNQNLWISWMRVELEENPEKYQNMHFVGEFYGEDEYSVTKELTYELFRQHPNLEMIITPSSASMPAVGDVIEELGAAAKFTGLGLPSEMADYIHAGSCPWMYLWNPIELGYLAAYAGAAIESGAITGAPGEQFLAGNQGYKYLQDAQDGGVEVVLANPLKFDAENVDMWKTVY